MLDQLLAVEFAQPPNPKVVGHPLRAAAPWTAERKRWWYAPGGSLPGLRSEPPSQLRRLFPWPESIPRSAHDGPWLSVACVPRASSMYASLGALMRIIEPSIPIGSALSCVIYVAYGYVAVRRPRRAPLAVPNPMCQRSGARVCQSVTC